MYRREVIYACKFSAWNMTWDNLDTTMALLLNYLVGATPVAEEKFTRNKIIIEKDNRCSQVLKEYLKSYSMINESLETKFGTAKQFIANIFDGRDDGNTKYQNIREQFFVMI